MKTSRSTDDVMRDMNDRAKAQGRYLDKSFSEIPRSPGSLLDRPDTRESDERIRKVQEYIARARGAQSEAQPVAEKDTNHVAGAPLEHGRLSEEAESDVTDASEDQVQEEVTER